MAFHPSRVTGESYLQTMAARPYTPSLDWVVEAPDGKFAAFCLIRPDDQSGTGLPEPVGVAPRHQRMGLGGAVRLGALSALAACGGRRRRARRWRLSRPLRLCLGLGFVPEARSPTFREEDGAAQGGASRGGPLAG